MALTALFLIAAAGACMIGAHDNHAGPELCFTMLVVAAMTTISVLGLVPIGSALPFVSDSPVATFPRALDPPPKRSFGF